MIKNIIYVEDGSVDVDALEEQFGNDTGIIVYRQGAVKPEILQLAEPINTDIDEAEEKFIRRLNDSKRIFDELAEMKMSQKVRAAIEDLYDTLFKG